jgi:hypothetical protein
MDSYPLGFLVVGGIYLLATGLLLRDKIVEGPLLKNFQKYFLTTKPWELKKYSSYANRQGTRDFKD